MGYHSNCLELRFAIDPKRHCRRNHSRWCAGSPFSNPGTNSPVETHRYYYGAFVVVFFVNFNPFIAPNLFP